MDQVLASEVLVVVLQKPDGLTFSEFRKLFFSTHGYPLDLSRYGYSSLQRLLDDVSELVLVEEKAAQEPLIKCRSLARHRYLFLREEELSTRGRLHSTDVPKDSPANSQIYNTTAIVTASELLTRTLSTYGTGLRLRKLKEAMRKEHGTDLEVLSKLVGSKDVIDFLHQLPNIKVLNPSKPNNCVIQLQEGLQNVPVTLSSSQSSIASEVEIPTLSVFACEDPELALEEHRKDLSNKAVVEDQQQHPNRLPLDRAKSKNYIFQFQGEIQKFSALLLSYLGNCPLGMKVRKLKDAAKKEYGMDLEKLSKDLGYWNLVDFLQQQPKVKIVAPGKTSNCVIHLQRDFKMLDFCAILNHNTLQQDSTTGQLASTTSKDTPTNLSTIPFKSSASPTSINLQDKDHNPAIDFKMLDFCEVLNHNTLQQDSTTNQSASTTSNNTSDNSSTIPYKSSASPKPISLQDKDHKPPTFQRNSFQPTTQAKRKPKYNLPNKTAVPAKTMNNSLRKCSLQKQEHHLKKTSNTSGKSNAVHTNPSLYKQQQERYIIPQVSRLRTPAISYSSAVSGTKPEAPPNRLALTNQMVPSSTNTNFSNMNQQSVMMHPDPPTFCLPISEYPQLTGKSQTVPPRGSPATGNHLLTSAQLPNSIEELRENILIVLSPYTNGMSLFQLQNTYRTMFKHKIPLNGYKNVKQLLEEMKEGVKVERIGIQDWVSLTSPDAVSTEIVEEFGLHNEHGCEASRQDTAINTHNLSGLERSPEDEDQHKQAAAKDLLHNLSGIKKSQNIEDAILSSCNTPQPPETTVLSMENSNITFDTPATNGTAKQMPVSTLPSTQTCLQKQINAIDDSSEHLLEGSTISTNSHLSEVHHKTQIAKPQTAENSYSSISPCNTTVATSSSSPSSEPPTVLLSSRKPLSNYSSTLDSHSATQLTVSTSDHNNLPAEVQHGPPYMENIDIISDSSFERLKDMRELKSNIVSVLNQQPDGMSVFQLKKLYSFMFQAGLPLHGHSSVKQLLMAMPDAVKLRGLGVQMLVFPFSSEMHCSTVITEDSGFSLLEMENGTFPTIQDVAHVSSTSELPAMCIPGNEPLDPEAPTFSPSSPLISDQFPSLQLAAVTSPLPLDSSRKSDLGPSHCQTLTSDTAFPYTVDNDNAVPTPCSLPTTHLSKFKGKAANSPSRLVCFKEHVDSLQSQNGRVNLAKQLNYSIMNHQNINSSHEAEFHDDEWPALSKDLFPPGSNKKTCTNLIPQKINEQDTWTISSNSSRTRAAVKFVVVSDACNVKDVNTESYFYGNSSEIPTFGSVVLPLLGSQQNSPVALITKSHSVQNYSKEKRHNEIV